MAMNVKPLNADTTFLIDFIPLFAPARASARFPGSFTVLIDPWVTGSSSVWKESFQISHHTTSPCISSLREIPQPDLIIISQDKPDHCHKQTLCTLPADARIRILATPVASKLIRSWKYFTHATIETMQIYNSKNNDSIIRIPIPGYSSFSQGGEVTVTYMPQRMDPTRLHNAIGLTYRAPNSTTTSVNGSVVNLLNLPPSPQDSPMAGNFPDPMNGPNNPMTPPDSPMELDGNSPMFPSREKTISVLYSPHGVAYTAIEPYASSHLAKESALPLTALFHSINTEENPWFMGGVVAVGYPGGAEIIRNLGARYWISAHDEVKDNRGWSVAWIKSRTYSSEEAQQKLDEETKSTVLHQDGKHGTLGPRTQIFRLDVGEQLRIV
ncbi:hypothetical protein D6C84_01849 [Aureobasidium pullulans]|uniref:Metallo-beta-lactamase domain-containing protein n=1 Tax=Aureobasidium pullulans TaxID=5580 RepID=A0A4S9Y8H6_AURPU|nr:hypothetical protein D6C84_01849 [Aureobasidium pullulans]